MARLLTNILVKGVNFKLTVECLKSFNQLKKDLTSTPIMNHPSWNILFKLIYDASNYAIGIVLGQR